jgi:transporter family protein
VNSPALCALVAALGFGVSGVLMKRGLQHASALAGAAISVSFTTALIWITAVWSLSVSRLFTWKILPFVAAGLLAPGLGRLSLYAGFHRVGVARTSALASATPLLAVALAVVLLAERPSRLLLLGAVAIVVGGMLLSYRAADDRSWDRRDLIFPALAVLSFASRDVLSRWGFRSYAEPLIAPAAAATTSFVLMWSVAAWQRSRHLQIGPLGLRILAVAGVIEGTAYLMMWRALSLGDVSLVSPLVNAYSIFTVVLAAVFLRDLERVTWRIALAAVLIVGGVFAVVRFGGGL